MRTWIAEREDGTVLYVERVAGDGAYDRVWDHGHRWVYDLPDNAVEVGALDALRAELDRRADEITELGNKFVDARRELDALHAHAHEAARLRALNDASPVREGFTWKGLL